MTRTTMELLRDYVQAEAEAYWQQDQGTRNEEVEAANLLAKNALAAIEQRIKALEADAKRWKATKELAGHWQDGSDETVTLFPDDATGTYHIICGKQSYFGSSFNEAVDRAMSEAALTKAVEISQEYKLP